MTTETIKQKTANSTTVLTPEQKGIVDRVVSQETDWFTIREDELRDFSLEINPLDLQHMYPEAWKMQCEKQYAFRWCERMAQRIDELTRSVSPPLRWALVTRTTLPPLAKYVDSILGCVACLDQALLFKPWSHHEIVKRAQTEMAEAKARSSGMDAIKDQRSDDKTQIMTGKEFEIGSRDEVQYEDSRDHQSADDLGDLVLEE